MTRFQLSALAVIFGSTGALITAGCGGAFGSGGSDRTYNVAVSQNSGTAGNSEIVRMSARGTDPVNLTDASTQEFEPCISPDGKRILFVSDRDGDLDVYVMNRDGSGVLPLTTDHYDDHSPSWSPDGTKVAFVSDRGFGGDDEIMIMNADGSDIMQLTGNFYEDDHPEFSMDGTKIVFDSHRSGDHENRSGDHEIYIMNADGSDEEKLTDNSVHDKNPYFMGSDKILYQSQVDGHYQIFVMDRLGTNVEQLTFDAENSEDPVIAPDGKRILFVSNRDGSDYELYNMRVDGSEQTQLTSNDYDDETPCVGWSPKGPFIP